MNRPVGQAARVEVDVVIPTADGRSMPGFFVDPGGAGRRPALLLIHEIFGLTAEIRAVALRMAGRGFAVVVPDLYHRSGLKPLCVARTMAAMARGQGDAFGDLEAARSWLVGQDGVDPEATGVMGFCMGGGFAVLLAARCPFKAAAVWYGEVPKELDALRGSCPVVASFGAKDRPFRGRGARLEASLTALGVEHDVVTYEEAGHAFAFPPGAHSAVVNGLSRLAGMNVGYVPSAAEAAWARVDAFFAAHLQGA
ncbi:MAG: dienelactone hydrolase family protein [Nannocystis sp.]|nr:dienelactone hydrolase family protein [Nannocystis sp.]